MRRFSAVVCVLAMSAAVLFAGSIPLDGVDDELKWMRHPGYLAEAEEGTPFGFELSGSSDVSGLAFISDPVKALGSAADHLSSYMAAKDDAYLAENYEFTKRDASFLLENMRDFLQVYSGTGRKINIMQTAATEACLYTKPVKASSKQVPDKDNPGTTKTITTAPYIKLISLSKAPKYAEGEK